MLDDRLIWKINLGNCFALVGSGPSCEMGYPTWRNLANKTYRHLLQTGNIKDKTSYERYLQHERFPELFRQAELDAGGRKELIAIVKQYLVPEPGKESRLYDFLVKWPFRCYLTTNFDNELQNRLKLGGRYFTSLRNRVEDFYPIRDGIKDVIVKLHSDLDHPDEVILTSSDYHRLSATAQGEYFRVKLRQIMEMFDICIIGHSLSDFDLKLILETAKQTASPQHPIYMITADFNPADKREFLERYNIAVTSYHDSNGEHRQLRRILSIADLYIAPWNKRMDALSPPPAPEEAEAAAALLIFRRLHDIQRQNASDPSEYVGPLILQALAKIAKPGISIDVLMKRAPLKSVVMSSEFNANLTRTALEGLIAKGLAEKSENSYWISEKGTKGVEEVFAKRVLEEDQAYGQFIVDLKSLYPGLNADQESKARQLLKETVVRVFRKRGIAIANAVFADQSVGPEDLSDIFRAVTNAASGFEDGELRAAFLQASHGFIIDSSEPQKAYLTSISQGYFLYHMVGLDPLCTRVRRDIFRHTVWLCDSSVLLPLMAVGSSNHVYAVDLFKRLNSLGATIYTTDKLLQETWQHLEYAVRVCKDATFQSSKFLAVATGKDRQRLNLFVDGFIRMSAEGRIGTWSDYLKLVCPTGCSRAKLDEQVGKRGLSVLEIEGLLGFKRTDWAEIQKFADAIRAKRRVLETFRSEDQVEAEAEVFQIIRCVRNRQYSIPDLKEGIDRTYFMSLSRVLNLIQPDLVTSWTPEAVYRYLTALPGEATDPDLLQQCMLNEYFYAGVSFIDKVRYQKFFGPSINAARASFAEQKEGYLNETEETHRADFDETFEKTPDLEKPFFVAQMGWRLAEAAERREQAANTRAEEAEARARRLEAEKRSAWKTRERVQQEQEAAHQVHIRDPKWIKKRLRQAKKKLRKKRR
ncbi:MAG: SIR2 family protein [Verrucomicrobiota bacterium]|jgi:predicted transcriptional regulator